MKIITVEDHFATREYLDCMHAIIGEKYPAADITDEKTFFEQGLPPFSPLIFGAEAMADRLTDVGQGRLREMDEAGIDMQVLSLTCPGVQGLDADTGATLARKTNDALAQIVRENPARYAGFASIAPQNPDGAAGELERAVKELGLKGALINSHCQGEYLDEKKYRVIFKKAEELGVPIYIHPREPSPDMIKPYTAYPGLPYAILGFTAEASLHAVRLICSGLFDQFPRLKIILGHMGEGLPFWLWRLDRHVARTVRNLKRKPSEYMRDNFLVTTSGMFSPAALMYAHTALGVENILFAVDYPFESNQEAVQFMAAAPLGDDDKEKICHLNAERLLAL